MTDVPVTAASHLARPLITVSVWQSGAQIARVLVGGPRGNDLALPVKRGPLMEAEAFSSTLPFFFYAGNPGVYGNHKTGAKWTDGEAARTHVRGRAEALARQVLLQLPARV